MPIMIASLFGKTLLNILPEEPKKCHGIEYNIMILIDKDINIVLA